MQIPDSLAFDSPFMSPGCMWNAGHSDLSCIHYINVDWTFILSGHYTQPG